MVSSSHLHRRLAIGYVRDYRRPQYRVFGSRVIGHCSYRCSLQHHIWKKTA